jgi:ribosomal protein S27E
MRRTLSAHVRRPCSKPAGSGVRRSYGRRRPEETVLYDVVERHHGVLFAQLEEEGRRVPEFVRNEFEAYLRCGRLEHGFVRVKCEGCRHKHLVASSCKGRGFCPSCASRRMAETGTKLVDEMLPAVPHRQWVLSFPIPLRLVFAQRPEVLSAVLAVVTRALSGDVIRRAVQRRREAQTGVVTFIQRFGSALNLNIHLHMLVPDGAWRFSNGKAHFERGPAPSDSAIERLLARLIRRITRCLLRAGVLVMEQEKPYFDVDTAPDDGFARHRRCSGALSHCCRALGRSAHDAPSRCDAERIIAADPRRTHGKSRGILAECGSGLWRDTARQA